MMPFFKLLHIGREAKHIRQTRAGKEKLVSQCLVLVYTANNQNHNINQQLLNIVLDC